MSYRRMPLRSAGVLLAAIILTGTTVVLTPTATAATLASSPPWCSQNNESESYHGNLMLGPKDLPPPEAGMVGAELRDYKHTGGDTDAGFLAEYVKKDDKGNDVYIYPGDLTDKEREDRNIDALGFDTTARTSTEMLTADSILDRYGSENGQYLAPYTTSFSARATPPRNLKTYDRVCNYYAYRVKTPFRVKSGITAPYFDQSGKGTQYYLDCELLEPIPSSQPSCFDPNHKNQLNVGYLVNYKYLERLPSYSP